jgi:hypothetical protein
LALVTGLSAAACQGTDGPRGEYRQTLRARLDEIVSVLETFEEGDKQAPATLSQGDKSREVSLPMSAEHRLLTAVRRLNNHLESVPLSLILQDPSGFDSWAALVQSDFASAQQRISAAFVEIRAALRENPRAFRSALGDFTRLTADGKLEFINGTTVFSADTLLNLATDEWLESVKQKTVEAHSTLKNQKQ